MTPNDLNRRVVADWLSDFDYHCTGRQLFRYTDGPPQKAFLRCVIELAWDDCENRFSEEFYGASRAEATAKAAAWILRKGWEVKDA